MSTSIVIVSPIASPAIDLKAPRGSTAVAHTAQTRKNVSTASRTKPLPSLTSGACGTLPSVAACSKRARSSRAARTAPRNCAAAYTIASRVVIRRARTKARVIAGLKWPPEMWPRFETMIPIAKPFASATATMSPPEMIPAPPPMKISVKAPTNSATPRRRASSSTPRGYGAHRTAHSSAFGSLGRVAEAPSSESVYEVECPHCRKQFKAVLLDGAAARYQGFKCPHCKLFVPFERADEQELVEKLD